MKSKSFKLYYLFACLGVLTVSYYPLYMGVKILSDMLADGVVLKENYPKYVIPYTPICIAVLLGVLLIPLFIRLFKRFAVLVGSIVSISAFFVTELILENKVLVLAKDVILVETKLEDWQMFMCYTPPGGWGTVQEYQTVYKEKLPIEILMGEYNPAFKLHFYLISVVLVLAFVACLYGFTQMIISGDRSRLRALVMQSTASVGFLGMCILACFTAFYRDGNIRVSPLSATLMTAFFILLGVLGGIYAGSFLLKRKQSVAVSVSAAVASLLTALMYVGELILLHGNLYSLGSGFIFKGLPAVVLSPFDFAVIIASGLITMGLARVFTKKA